MTVAIALPTLQLSDDEKATLGQLRGKITRCAKKNEVKNAYYEGTHQARSLDIAVPPNLADLEINVEYPATVTDVMAERLLWNMWRSVDNLLGLDKVFADNNLGVEQSQATLDALITGVSFIAVGSGDESAGEPEVLVTAESPSTATMEWNARTRRATSGLLQSTNDNGSVVGETLMLPNQSIKLERPAGSRKMILVDRDEHNLGRVMMSRLANRERASDRNGRSEITRAIRYYTDAIARTLLGMEINREFYTAPQRYGLGVDPEQFGISGDQPRKERVRRGWEISMTRMNFLPRDEDTGELPQIGQFTPAPPTPYIDQVKHYAQLIAAAAAIPATYLGFQTDNPPSADATRVLESRLVKRAELRQRMFERTWLEVARLSLMVAEGSRRIDEERFAKISLDWAPAVTPTPASDTDRAVKLVQAQIVPSDSEVAARTAGLSKEDIAEIAEARRSGTVGQLVAGLPGAAAQARQDDPAVAALAGVRNIDDAAGSGSGVA